MPVLKRTKDKLQFAFERPDLNQLIDEGSTPMQLYKLINKLDFSAFYAKHSSTGAPNYPPEDMMAVVMLAFSEGIFSSRKIEEKCQRDIYYMFLTEQRKPDHSTFARFIQKYKEEIPKLGVQVVLFARKHKIATYETISIDGSKFAAATSKKHSKNSKNLERHESYLKKKLEETLKKVEETDRQETEELAKLKKVEESVKGRLERTQKAKGELSKRKAEIKEKKHRENHQINIEEPEARMMQSIATNGYNPQLSVDTATGIIVAQSITVSRSDNHEFSPQHKKTEEVLGADKTRAYVADSGYNSEETLEYIQKNKVHAYINDAREKEKQASVEEIVKRNKSLTIYDFVFDKEKNVFLCPNQKHLIETEKQVYECRECEGCALLRLCCRKKAEKKITKTSFTLLREAMSEKMKENNKEKMNQRKTVERSFGQMKWNLRFRRFHRKGISGASVELNLLALSINMAKIIAIFYTFIVLRLVRKNIYRIIRAIYNYLVLDTSDLIFSRQQPHVQAG